MMNQHHVADELSAYLDGQARRPEQIARHIEQCPACAARYEELATLSARVKALPPPDVRPEFTTRVMAHVREAGMVPRRSVRPWLLGTAVMGVVVMLAGAWLVQNRIAPNDSWAREASDDARVRTIARPHATEPWSQLDSMSEDVTEPAEDDELLVQVLVPLGDSEWSTPLVQAWGPGQDLDTVLQTLDEAENAQFVALLEQYQAEMRRNEGAI